jgi:hypothetical protein
MMLHAMHNFVKQNIKFRNAPSGDLIKCLPGTAMSPRTNILARILSRQIKHAIHALLEDMTTDLLEDLEAETKVRTTSSWLVSLGVFLVICLCMEEIQATVALINGALPVDSESQQVRAKCLKIGLDIEDLFRTLTTLFHFIYSTHKQPHDKSFNPVRDGLTLDAGLEWSEGESTLIAEIRQIIANQGKSVILKPPN